MKVIAGFLPPAAVVALLGVLFKYALDQFDGFRKEKRSM